MKLLPSDTDKRVRFRLSADTGSKVFVAGTFNNWNPTANQMNDIPDSGHFKVVLHVPTGTYEYKFVVNGAWIVDPECANLTPNTCGSKNSVFQV